MAFDPSEPRDDEGQWTDGGASSGKDAHVAAKAAVTPAQAEALSNYSGAMYRDVNPRLRAGKSVAAGDKKDVAQMDAAFSGAKTKANLVVYRGVSGDFIDKLTPGASFKDGGFVSASSSEKGAANFVRGDKAALLEIRVPKGSSAISTIEHSVFAKSEQEIVLNRGGSFKVASVTPGRRGRPAKIVVTYHG